MIGPLSFIVHVNLQNVYSSDLVNPEVTKLAWVSTLY